MKTLVLGGSGQLGSDVVRALAGNDVCAPARSEVDITKPNAVAQCLDTFEPDLVINCAALHDPSQCEEDPAHAMEVNCFAVADLARATALKGCKLLHISTDYVFDGKKREGYTEEDPVNPLMWYGKSKYAGECAALTNNPKTFIVRVQSLYGKTPPSGKGLNFVELMLKLSKERDEIQVDQCRMAPTWTWPLAQNLVALGASDHYGLYHMSSMGEASWYTFAKKIFECSGQKVKVTPVANDFFPKNFERPENTLLLKERLERVGLNLMPTWERCLEEYLKD